MNQLLPGEVIRYTRFGDRFELPSGTRLSLAQLVGFKLELAPGRTAPLPEEGAIVRRVTRRRPDVAEAGADTGAAARSDRARRAAEREKEVSHGRGNAIDWTGPCL